MTVKKLTLAAALSIGMLSLAIPAVSANEIQAEENMVNTASQVVRAPQQDMPVITGQACPLGPCDTQPKAIIKGLPQAQPCPICPQETGAACPIEDPCDPCDAQPACPIEDPCDVQPACPICPQMDACPEPAEPACAACPNVPADAEYFEQQVYAYPSSVYGNNTQFSGGPHNYSLSQGSGVQVARDAQGNLMQGTTTGAAASIPCLQNFGPQMSQGVPADRTASKLDGATCPMSIQTQDSMEALKKTMIPVEIDQTGAAAGLMSYFPDVSDDYWASYNINKLASENVVVGYPDGLFKPNHNVTRAEFASMLVKGLQLEGSQEYDNQIYSDVPQSFWGDDKVDKITSSGYMAGYPDDTFKPQNPVSRAEAITSISKAIACDVTDCDAEKVLSEYCDGDDVASWARMPIAKALQAGILKDTPTPNQIMPNQDASRAEISAMLSQARVALGIDTEPVACAETGQAAFVEQQDVVKIPTLSVEFEDEVTAKAAHVGDQFAAHTTEDITINGVTFPKDSRVNGHVVEVVRPTGNSQGALKLAFTEIENGDSESLLPRQILTAQVQKEDKPNGLVRTVEWPFVWTGRLLGNTGRTLGGTVVTAGNAVEEVINGVGIATGEIFTGKFKASGRSLLDSGKALITAPVDITRTAINGTAGLFMITSDEIAYLVDKDGFKVSSINPREKVSIAFGCAAQQ